MNNEMPLPFSARLVRAAVAVALGAAMMAPAAQAREVEAAVVKPNTTTVTITDHQRDGCGTWFLGWTSSPTFSTYEIWRKPSTGTTYTLYQTVADDYVVVVVGTSGAYDFKIKAGTVFSAPVQLTGSTIDCNNN